MNGLQKKIIKRALDNLDDLSERDNDFIMTLADLPDDAVLSDKRNQWLNDIWGRLDDL